MMRRCSKSGSEIGSLKLAHFEHSYGIPLKGRIELGKRANATVGDGAANQALPSQEQERVGKEHGRGGCGQESMLTQPHTNDPCLKREGRPECRPSRGLCLMGANRCER